eukprot:9986385-Prorocentrum_lima.AAC.1
MQMKDREGRMIVEHGLEPALLDQKGHAPTCPFFSRSQRRWNQQSSNGCTCEIQRTSPCGIGQIQKNIPIQ